MEKIGYSSYRPWGKYKILDQGKGYKVKRIEIKPHKRFSLQSHKKRTETWIIVQGKFEITLGKKLIKTKPGDIIKIRKNQKHRAKCLSPKAGVFIEILQGNYLGEDDEIRWSDDFGRQ